MVKTGLKFTERGVEQVISVQRVEVANDSDGVQPGARSVDVCDHDGAIEGDDRRIVELDQAIVKRENLRPIGRFIVLCDTVTGGDAGLQMILADFFAGGGPGKMEHA